jgi:hypothetical protein
MQPGTGGRSPRGASRAGFGSLRAFALELPPDEKDDDTAFARQLAPLWSSPNRGARLLATLLAADGADGRSGQTVGTFRRAVDW